MACDHPEDKREYDPGNHVPPYGWEIYPGWYCTECGDMLDEDEVPETEDPDFDRQYELENRYVLEDEMRNPL